MNDLKRSQVPAWKVSALLFCDAFIRVSGRALRADIQTIKVRYKSTRLDSLDYISLETNLLKPALDEFLTIFKDGVSYQQALSILESSNFDKHVSCNLDNIPLSDMFLSSLTEVEVELVLLPDILGPGTILFQWSRRDSSGRLLLSDVLDDLNDYGKGNIANTSVAFDRFYKRLNNSLSHSHSGSEIKEKYVDDDGFAWVEEPLVISTISDKASNSMVLEQTETVKGNGDLQEDIQNQVETIKDIILIKDNNPISVYQLNGNQKELIDQRRFSCQFLTLLDFFLLTFNTFFVVNAKSRKEGIELLVKLVEAFGLTCKAVPLEHLVKIGSEKEKLFATFRIGSGVDRTSSLVVHKGLKNLVNLTLVKSLDFYYDELFGGNLIERFAGLLSNKFLNFKTYLKPFGSNRSDLQANTIQYFVLLLGFIEKDFKNAKIYLRNCFDISVLSNDDIFFVYSVIFINLPYRIYFPTEGKGDVRLNFSDLSWLSVDSIKNVKIYSRFLNSTPTKSDDLAPIAKITANSLNFMLLPVIKLNAIGDFNIGVQVVTFKRALEEVNLDWIQSSVPRFFGFVSSSDSKDKSYVVQNTNGVLISQTLGKKNLKGSSTIHGLLYFADNVIYENTGEDSLVVQTSLTKGLSLNQVLDEMLFPAFLFINADSAFIYSGNSDTAVSASPPTRITSNPSALRFGKVSHVSNNTVLHPRKEISGRSQFTYDDGLSNLEGIMVTSTGIAAAAAVLVGQVRPGVLRVFK